MLRVMSQHVILAAGLKDILERPKWWRVPLDFITDLIFSQGKTIILVVVDLFRRWLCPL